MDDFIQAFMQIAKHRSCLKCGCTGKFHDSTSLNLKAIFKCEDPRPMAKAMESYLGANGLNTKAYALKGTKLFGSSKRKLSFSLGSKCDSH